MVATALPFHVAHPAYQAGFWDRRRRREEGFIAKLAKALPRLHLLANQHEKIMDGTLLRGVKKAVASPRPLKSYELSKRQVKILRRLKAGDEINPFGAHWQLVQGSRRCNIRSEDVHSLLSRGLITSAFAMAPYGLTALDRVV